MKQTPDNNELMIAAFMGQGFNQGPVNIALAHWDGGELELFIQMMQYVPFCDRVENAVLALDPEYIGVIHYEVYEEFGTWYCQEVICTPKDNVPPCHESACNWIKEHLCQFFTKDLIDGDVRKQRIEEAINAVPVPDEVKP